MRTALCFVAGQAFCLRYQQIDALWNAKVCKQMKSPTLLPALIVIFSTDCDSHSA